MKNKMLKNQIRTILSKRLKELRKKHNYTQRYIASILDITYQSYQAYEIGRSMPTVKKIIKLAELYDVSVNFLLGLEELVF